MVGAVDHRIAPPELAPADAVVGEGSPAERQRARLAYAKDDSGHALRVGAAQAMVAVGIGTAAILPALCSSRK